MAQSATTNLNRSLLHLLSKGARNASFLEAHRGLILDHGAR